nr:uncharacterized protein LOC128694081 [Cherax quadricarinatus]
MYRRYLQDLSGGPPTTHLQEAPEGVFTETHNIVGDAHLKAARAGAAHREQLSNSRVDCVAVTLSSGVDFDSRRSLAVEAGNIVTVEVIKTKSVEVDNNASVEVPMSQSFEVFRNQPVKVIEAQSVELSKKDAGVSPMLVQPAADISSSNILEMSAASQSVSNDSGVVTSPGENSHNNSSINPSAVESSNCGSSSAVGRSSSTEHSPLVNSSSNGSIGNQSPSIKSRGSAFSLNPMAKSTGHFSFSSSARCDGRRKRHPYSENIELEDFMSPSNTPEFRRRPAEEFRPPGHQRTSKRVLQSAPKGSDVAMDEFGSLGLQGTSKTVRRQASNSFDFAMDEQESKSPEFRGTSKTVQRQARNSIDFAMAEPEIGSLGHQRTSKTSQQPALKKTDLTTNQPEFSTSGLRRTSKTSWDTDSSPSLSNDEVIVSRPVVEASRAKSPLYPATSDNLITSKLTHKTQKQTQKKTQKKHELSSTRSLINVLPFRKTTRTSGGLGTLQREEPKGYLKGTPSHVHHPDFPVTSRGK